MEDHKGQKITVYSLKGGQGKTSISVALAKELEYGIVTNDTYSPLQKIFPKELLLKLEPNDALPTKEDFEGADLIFDFGGYLDERVIPALEMSDYVIIPIVGIDDLNEEGFISTVAEVAPHNNNIIVVLNRMNDEAVAEIRKDFADKGFPYPVFEIKNSKVMEVVISEGRSVSDIVRDGGLRKYFYKSVENQVQKLINYITKEIK